MVDDSDDKTTTFTLPLFNFFPFPQALLSISDISVPLSVFLSVHLSSLLFVFFAPTCHELTTFLSQCVFLHSSPFFLFICSLSIPPLAAVALSVLRNQYFSSVLPFIFVLFYPAAFSVCLLITLYFHLCLSCFISSVLTSHRLVFLVLFFSPSSAFDDDIFFFSSCSSHIERGFSHLPFKSLSCLCSAPCKAPLVSGELS